MCQLQVTIRVPSLCACRRKQGCWALSGLAAGSDRFSQLTPVVSFVSLLCHLLSVRSMYVSGSRPEMRSLTVISFTPWLSCCDTLGIDMHIILVVRREHLMPTETARVAFAVTDRYYLICSNLKLQRDRCAQALLNEVSFACMCLILGRGFSPRLERGLVEAETYIGTRACAENGQWRQDEPQSPSPHFPYISFV